MFSRRTEATAGVTIVTALISNTIEKIKTTRINSAMTVLPVKSYLINRIVYGYRYLTPSFALTEAMITTII